MRFLATVLLISAGLLMAGCAPGQPAKPEQATPSGVVDVTIEGLKFEMPDQVPAGWVTFRMANRSAMTHMGVIERMPEGYGIKEQQEQAAPVFQEGMDLIIAGDVDAAMAKFGELPEWFGRIVFMGGPGLLGPGRTSETTMFLEPGDYLLECYVKTAGIFHSYNPDPAQYGMVHAFTVTGEPSGAQEPKADVEMTISSQRGIELSGTPVAGVETMAVHFADQKVHENFVGHDVHLVRLKPETDIGKLIAWMNWASPNGLQTPAPAEFLGGTNEMPAGKTAYFTVRLEPGDYAFIAEVPSADEKGMLKRFTVK